MRPFPCPSALLKAAFAVIFLILDFSLFITAAIAWSHHKHLCIAETIFVYNLNRDIEETDAPYALCGPVRWFPYALLVQVSLIGFFVAFGFFAAAFLKPRDHNKGTCTATLIFLSLLLLTIIVGWTPPAQFKTTSLIAGRPSSPSSPAHTLAPPHDKLAKRAHPETELEEALRDFHISNPEETHQAQEDKTVDDICRDPYELENLIRGDLSSHRHFNGIHGITGAFLINWHWTKFGSLNGSVILAHLTLFVGILLAVFDCILPDGKPKHDDRKRDSVSSEI